MSEIITRADGTDVEVFSAEEIEAQKQEAIESYKIENPDKSAELVALQEELRIKNEKLAKTEDKDLNFANLRKQKEEAEKKVADILKGVDDKITTAKKEVMEGVMQDHYNDTLKALSEDEEMKKKIEFHYKRLGDVAITKEAIGSKLRDAYLLATKPEGYDALNSSVISSGGVGKINIRSGVKLTEEERVVAGKLGISGDDLKKYAKE